MDELAIKLRVRIAEARKAANLSQQEVAEALGMQPTAVSKIESGAREVSSTELARLAHICGRPLAWFFGTEESSVVLSLRTAGASSEALMDLAWATEFVEAYAFLKKLVS